VDGWWFGVKAKVSEYFSDDGGVFDGGDDAHTSTASLAGFDIDTAGNLWDFTSSLNLGNSSQITQTSALGATTLYSIYSGTYTPSGYGYERDVTDPDLGYSSFGLTSQQKQYSYDPFYSVVQYFTPDARFGSQINFVASEVNNPQQSLANITTTRTQNIVYNSTPDIFNFQSLDTVTSVNGNSSDVLYTPSNRQLVTTTPTGHKIYQTLDQQGKIVALQVGSLQATQFVYDSHGRLQQTQQGTRMTQYQYNSVGLVSSVTDALNETTQFSYDVANNLYSQILPDGYKITYGYDRDGNLTSVDPVRPQYLTYNLFDELASFQPPAVNGVTTNTVYTYDNDKRLTQVTLANGDTVQFSYNLGARHPSSITTSDEGQYIWQYQNGQPVWALTPSAMTEVYQQFQGNVPAQINYYGNSGMALAGLNFTFDNNFEVASSQLTSYLTNATQSVNYSYDADFVVSQAGDEAITRDPVQGALSTLTLGSESEIYTYDTQYGELASISAQFGGQAIFTQSMTRDSLGRITALNEVTPTSSSTYTYQYDLGGRLVQVIKNGSIVDKYQYSQNSDRIAGKAISATYDTQDRTITYNSDQYTYNVNGWLAQKLNSVTQVEYDYVYNDLGYLKQVTTPAKLVNYTLDAFGNRLMKFINGTLTQYYVWENSTKLTALIDAQGNILERFVYGAKSNVPDYMIKGGVDYKLISDHLGSVRLVINAQTGAIAEQLDYDEFGVVLNDTNPGFQPFGFAGGQYDSDTGLVHFGARDYDASTGRWLSKDPILFAGGDTNLYGYVANDPVNWTDPTGKCPLCAVGIAVGGGAAIGAVSNGFGTYLAGGNAQQIISSAGTGAIAGGAAVLTSIGAVLGAAPTATGVALGVGIDLGIQVLFAPTSLPNGTSLNDVQNGVNAIKNGPSCPN
jgi:RHS repeat-associated protein